MSVDPSNYYNTIFLVSDVTNRVPSVETLAQVAEYEDPLNHQEPKYAEVDQTKIGADQSNLLIY
jgi:hypothetical protein